MLKQTKNLRRLLSTDSFDGAVRDVVRAELQDREHHRSFTPRHTNTVDSAGREARELVRQEIRNLLGDVDHPFLDSPVFREAVRSAVLAEIGKLMTPQQLAAIQPDAFTAAVRNAVVQSGLDVETLRLVDECRTELLQIQLRSRRLISQALWRLTPQPPRRRRLVPKRQNFDDLLRQLSEMHPHLYPRWAQINFEENPAEFAARPEGSCTIGKRATDEPFSGFVAPYLTGRVLDVGCGPYAVPLYLEGYPAELIYGIDPIEPFEPHPFTFARGFAEFIPFPDTTFDTVIAATSLDHSLSLSRALSEIRRVIRPGGSFLVWDGFVKGCPPYDPDNPKLQPIDDYHFFHFDEPWFEAAMTEYRFVVREKLAFDPSPHNPQYCTSYFYCLHAS